MRIVWGLRNPKLQQLRKNERVLWHTSPSTCFCTFVRSVSSNPWERPPVTRGTCSSHHGATATQRPAGTGSLGCMPCLWQFSCTRWQWSGHFQTDGGQVRSLGINSSSAQLLGLSVFVNPLDSTVCFTQCRRGLDVTRCQQLQSRNEGCSRKEYCITISLHPMICRRLARSAIGVGPCNVDNPNPACTGTVVYMSKCYHCSFVKWYGCGTDIFKGLTW